MDIAIMDEFNPRTADKVVRLLDILEQMIQHPTLQDRFAMYGGTAINLFMLDAPRLSVDIDATYIGSASRDEMLAAKPTIEKAIADIAEALDYSLELGKPEHAGRTFFLGYRSDHGHDTIKIDFTYLNRIPLLPLEKRSTIVCDDLFVPMLSDAELIGGKAKAFFGRVKVRDIYDVANLARMLNAIADVEQQEFYHQTILYKSSLSAAFPFGFEGREERFSNRQSELEAELYPMLRESDVRPSLDDLMQSAATFIADWVLPRNDAERTYLKLLAEGSFEPALLFGESDIASRAAISPEAAWKITNLEKMLD